MATLTAVPAAMVHNQFFEEFTDKVRVKPIPWEGYSRAGLISSTELSALKSFQQQRHESNGVSLAQFVPLLVSLTEKLSSLDALQYLLVMLDDLVEAGDSKSLAGLRERLDAAGGDRVLFRCMEKKDDYLGLKAAKILVGVAVATGAKVDFTRLFATLERYMRSELTSVVDVAIQAMQSALRVPKARHTLFNEAPGCLAQMLDVLRRTLVQPQGSRAVRGVVAVPQTQYEVVFCLWLLSFERQLAAVLDKTYDIIPVLVDIARSTGKEKVIRVVVSTLSNLLLVPDANVPSMLVGGVPACLRTLAVGRSFKDEDLKAALAQLTEDLAGHSGVMTTWDEYCAEVASGKLHWSPAHRSEQFWKMHVARMDEADHRIVRQLAQVLGRDDETALAVACHDLAQYVKFNPDGKRLLARIGAKAQVMALMTSEFPEVRYEALMCVQQIMLNAWRN
ncbi:H(+)-transporting V1 sector ATPase subunit H [Kickxella alabastrina]|uniref:H(+)-transporting V1 sector ATPase subunit H n=1 Tax=Kickxella alabastrina TaxID=61397 RepID=A0ACC1IU86_9FUNG|nr:H(+)-transporting V1 sector ATPase subunit H [Kickxella alabastrina]